jgi:hypothetical protein
MKQEITDIITSDTSTVVEYTFADTLLNREENTPQHKRRKKYRLFACTVMSTRKGKIANQHIF